MAARLESSDGTTLAMMMPSTPGESRDASAKRLRRRTPHSSAVWPCTVRSRHWLTRRRRSKAPMVMLLLPTSRASSIMFVAHGAAWEAAGPRGHPQGPAPQLYWADSSGEYKGFRAVVRAQFQEAGGIEARGGAGDDAAGLFDAHALAVHVAGAARKLIQNRVAAAFQQHAAKAVNGGKQADQQIFARVRAAGGEAQRSGFGRDLRRKGRMIDVHAEAGDGYGIDELHQNAGCLSVAEHDVVGPA